MGLTIHYTLKSSTQSMPKVRSLVEQLRQRALDLPFKEVSNLFEVTGDRCDFEKCQEDDRNRWLLIQCGQYVERGRFRFAVKPKHIVAFSAWPGEGCEEANFGLCRYPGIIQVKDQSWPHRTRHVRTGLSGWSWCSFCKTEFASNPEFGGLPNFLTCHLAVIATLDHAQDLGVLEHVSDEGEFWERRSLQALAESVGEWNTMLAGVVGKLNDAFGNNFESEISRFSDFEHLKAVGRSGDHP